MKTPDLVDGLKSGKIFGVALDVFEGEKAFMFKDMTKVGYVHTQAPGTRGGPGGPGPP